MPNRYTRRQFFGIGALAATALIAVPAFGAPKPCWELNPNNPNWCPPPSPTPTPSPSPAPSPSRSTRGLLLLF